MARAPADSEGVRYFSLAFKFRVPDNHGAPHLRKTSIGILRSGGHMVAGATESRSEFAGEWVVCALSLLGWNTGT